MPEPKDIRTVLKICRRKGFIIKQGRSMHYKVYLPNKKMVTISSTPSDTKCITKIYWDFKRNGFPLI